MTKAKNKTSGTKRKSRPKKSGRKKPAGDPLGNLVSAPRGGLRS